MDVREKLVELDATTDAPNRRKENDYGEETK